MTRRGDGDGLALTAAGQVVVFDDLLEGNSDAEVEAEEGALKEDMIRYRTGRTPGSDIGERETRYGTRGIGESGGNKR